MATKVSIDINGKGGFACSYNVDLAKGCANGCVGCYAAYTSMLGNKFHVEESDMRELDEKKFRSACKSAVTKGIRYARCGKHTDCCSSGLLPNLKSVLKIAGEEGLKLVVVSKSLVYDKEIAALMKDHGHILHMSLGMITKAPSDIERQKVFVAYRVSNVKSYLRIIGDVTKELDLFITRELGKKPDLSKCIVTPMRYRSKSDAEKYGTDLSKYKYQNGYYRPLEMHSSWNDFSNFCGEVNGELKCCKCLAE